MRSERYRGAFEGPRFPLGNGQELVYVPLTRAAKALPASSLRFLQGCRTWATLDDHAFRLCQELQLDPMQGGEVRRELGTLAQAGLLVSEEEIRGVCRRGPSAPAPRLTALGIPTRQRTVSLQRCLKSYIDDNRQRGRELHYVVVDDSPNAETQRANRQLLPALKALAHGTIAYAGLEERTSFAAALIQAGLPADEVHFAILPDPRFPITTGSSRNALLLHAVGEALLQVDDDTVCQLAPATGARAGLALSSEYDPTEFWFPTDDEPLPDGAPEPGMLAIHETLLGRGLAEVAEMADVDLQRAGSGFYRHLEPAGGQILVTAAGVMGDSGMGSPLYFLSLDGPSRARLLQSEAVYRQALTRQRVVRAVTQPTICDGPYCMALNLGLDNRDLLPPYSPVQRNQDGVFAAVLRGCFAGSLFGFLPWTLLHRAPVSRQLAPDAFWRGAAEVGSGQILEALIGSFAPGPNRGDTRKCLRGLGQALEDWGSAPPGDFEELVRLLLWNQASRKAAQLDRLLRAHKGQPPFWAADVRRLLAIYQEALPERGYVVPADLVTAFGHEALATLQQMVLRFGRLLRVWPDLVAAARDLRARGRRLALPV